jgi:hypothetical protein
MDTIDIEIPADTKMVKLALKDRTPQLTLRSLLPTIRWDVELIIEDSFGAEACDRITIKAGDGDKLMKMLERSRVLEGNMILDLRPSVIKMRPLVISVHSGRYGELANTGVLEIFVVYPKPDEED